MAASERGEKQLIDVVTAIATTTTHDSDDTAALAQEGYRGRVMWILQVTAAPSADFDVVINYMIGSNVLPVAARTTINSTGLWRFAPDGDFDGVTDAVPLPNQVVYTRNAGTLTGNLYQLIGG